MSLSYFIKRELERTMERPAMREWYESATTVKLDRFRAADHSGVKLQTLPLHC